MIQANELERYVRQLLVTAGVTTTALTILPCAKGGNNRTFRVETDDKVFALKEYFRQPADKRDRLASEFAFLTYANRVAPGMAPIAYAKDDEAGVALYEFIEGIPLSTDEIEEADVEAAANFFCALNQVDLRRHADDLPLASEACFSIKEHIQLVSNRIASLKSLVPADDQDHQAAARIETLSKHWDDIAREIKQTAQVEEMSLSESLEIDQRCISPSDFGFHNALRTADGTLRFLDFEYAGWDDPAKMVGDFFSQLAVPVSLTHFDKFTNMVMKPFFNSHELVQRAKLLRTTYQIKWCCIALNVFIPVNLARRQFANPELNVFDLKTAQLLKAESLLKHLEVKYV